MLPKLRLHSGDPYPPELDIYYKQMNGTYNPMDPMENFWTNINRNDNNMNSS